MKKLYRHVALGGTFDILHAGHKRLLAAAFKVGQKVTIGITTDKFSAKQGLLHLQNQYQRKRVLYKFLKRLSLLNRAQLVFIEDIYGPTIRDKSYQALVVSKQALQNAHKINIKRLLAGFPKLVIVTIPIVKAYDGKPISSTRVKDGEIDPFGKSYQKMLVKISGRRLTEDIRKKLKRPFGKIVKNNKMLSTKANIITIGDASTLKFNSLQIRRRLSVVDFLIGRRKIYSSLYELGFKFSNPSVIVRNSPGQISNSLILEIARRLRSRMSDQVILVEGEEDLAVICATLLAPIPSTVFYGQPKKGLVMVEVDIKAKNRLCELLKLT